MEYEKNEIVFTNLAIRFKENTLMPSLSKAIQKLFEVESLNFEVLVNINSLVEEALNLSNRDKRVIREVEDELSIDRK